MSEFTARHKPRDPCTALLKAAFALVQSAESPIIGDWSVEGSQGDLH